MVENDKKYIEAENIIKGITSIDMSKESKTAAKVAPYNSESVQIVGDSKTIRTPIFHTKSVSYDNAD